MSRTPKWLRNALAWAQQALDEARDTARPDAPMLDWDAAAETGGWFVRSPTEWVARHVEHLDIETDRTALRRLTIDLDLPDEEASFEREGERLSYCVPVTWMAKKPPRSRIDLRDEDGKVLPLLTRMENALLSRDALLAAIEDATATTPSEDMEVAVDLCVFEEDGLAALGSSLIRVTAEEEGLAFRDAAERARIERTARHLAANSALWFVLHGKPWERRVIKLAYAITLGRPPRLVRPHMVVTRTVELDGEPVSIKELAPGRVKWRRSLGRALQRAAGTVGLAAIDLSVPVPDVGEPRSYHFQVQAPPGLEVRRLRLHARLLDEDGKPLQPRTHLDGRSGHLYFADAAHVLRVDDADPDATARAPTSGEPRRPIEIGVALRMARQGFLNIAVLAACVITAALWGYQAEAETASHPSNVEVAAAVLLVVPALLLLFAARPDENPWAARMLMGIRMVMLLLGLTSASAAASLVGVGPWTHASEALVWHALVASACAGGLALAWTAYWEPVRWWLRREPSRRRYGAGASAATAVVLAVVISRWAGASVTEQAAVAAAISGGVLGALSAWTIFGWLGTAEGPSGAQRMWVGAAALLALLVLAAAIGIVPGADATPVWAALTGASTVAFGGSLWSTTGGHDDASMVGIHCEPPKMLPMSNRRSE